MRRAPAFLAATVIAAAALAQPAFADDALIVSGNSSPQSIYAVVDDTALFGGFFKEEHLDVTIQYKNRPGQVATALAGSQFVASGAADVATTTLEPVLQNYGTGLHLQAFFARDPQYEFVLAVLEDSPIKTLADFKGAKIGEITAHGTSEILTAALAGAGVKRSDFTYVPIGQGESAIAALAAKKVDGAAFPFVELASYEVKAHLKFRYLWDPLTKDISDASYSATPATIAAKPELLARFARAIVKASIVVRENPKVAARYFLQGSGIPITEQSLRDETALLELIKDQLPGVDPLSKKIGAISLRGVDVYSKYLFDNGVTTQIVPASILATNRFIAAANDFDHKAFIARAKALR
jgi:NitT/TauT family transport system substrate-binding protein